MCTYIPPPLSGIKEGSWMGGQLFGIKNLIFFPFNFIQKFPGLKLE